MLFIVVCQTENYSDGFYLIMLKNSYFCKHSDVDTIEEKGDIIQKPDQTQHRQRKLLLWMKDHIK